MTKKTAITKLLEDLRSDMDSEVSETAKEAIHECIITVTSYLEPEKLQIIEAYDIGMGHYGDANCRAEADKYYKETFNETKKSNQNT